MLPPYRKILDRCSRRSEWISTWSVLCRVLLSAIVRPWIAARVAVSTHDILTIAPVIAAKFPLIVCTPFSTIMEEPVALFVLPLCLWITRIAIAFGHAMDRIIGL